MAPKRRSIMDAGSEAGSDPVSMLPPKSRYARFFIFPNDFGTAPLMPERKPICAQRTATCSV